MKAGHEEGFDEGLKDILMEINDTEGHRREMEELGFDPVKMSAEVQEKEEKIRQDKKKRENGRLPYWQHFLQLTSASVQYVRTGHRATSARLQPQSQSVFEITPKTWIRIQMHPSHQTTEKLKKNREEGDDAAGGAYQRKKDLLYYQCDDLGNFLCGW